MDERFGKLGRLFMVRTPAWLQKFGLEDEHQIRRRLAGPHALERLDSTISDVDGLRAFFQSMGVPEHSLEGMALLRVREALFFLGAETRFPFTPKGVEIAYPLDQDRPIKDVG